MSQPLPKPTPLKRTQPRAIPKDKQKINKQKFDNPACCHLAFMQFIWNGDCWVTPIETGGGEPSFDQEVFCCCYCGTKLNEQTPAMK